MAKISVTNFNRHLDQNGYQAQVEEMGHQALTVWVNVRKHTAFHTGGPTLASCKAFKEHGTYVIRDRDAVQVCTQLRIVPPRRNMWDG
jgi:hypothetical protein